MYKPCEMTCGWSEANSCFHAHRVLLGSFSNYLVTKSSVPVMVARKRLLGRKAKNVNPHVRLTNNLTPTNRLAAAKID